MSERHEFSRDSILFEQAYMIACDAYFLQACLAKKIRQRRKGSDRRREAKPNVEDLVMMRLGSAVNHIKKSCCI